MRILFANYEYPPLGGGGGNATREIARRLAARGHAVAVLTTRFRGQSSEETDEGVRLIRLKAPRRTVHQCSPLEMLGFMLAGVARGPARVQAFRPEAVLAFFAMPSGPAAWRMARAFRIPYALCLRGGDVPGFYVEKLAGLHRISKPALRVLWRDAASIVANSAGLAQLARTFEPRCPVEVIPNGVDVQRFRPAKDEGSPAAGPPSDKVTLLTAGRLTPQKAVDRLLRCLATMPADLPPWRLRVAGDGPLRGELEAEARRLGLAQRVEFLGWQPKEGMPALYREADAFVLVSTGEGSPNVVLEAKASGLAVLATRVRGSEELIEDGVDGLLANLSEDSAIRGALERLIGDAELRRRLGVAARRSVERRSWDSVADAYEALCRRLINNPTRIPRGLGFLGHLCRSGR
ncbi:MAG: glycosyltransferase family 4 protein [Candidatus Sumerlaeota bacterium]|nr:glycosyltransferase family 4 protein [Candidatus Sumerlaeota bacterium]